MICLHTEAEGQGRGKREERGGGKAENSPEAIPPVRPTTMEDSIVSKVSAETLKQLTEHEMWKVRRKKASFIISWLTTSHSRGRRPLWTAS